jgi:methyl-accepting chemotaxis protein-1 (serine sensor receptor)
MLIVVGVIIASWIAMRRVLLLPLQDVIGHIRAIAAGDLTQPFDASGKNEMALLAQRPGDAKSAGEHGWRGA